MTSLKDKRSSFLSGSIFVLGMTAIMAFPAAANAAEEVRINDSSGLLLGAASLSAHREASVFVAVEQSGDAAPVELSLTGTFRDSSVQKAAVANGTASFNGVAPGAYLLQASPSNVKIVSVKVIPGEEHASGSSDAYLNAAAVGVAAAGGTGLIIAGSNMNAGDDGSISVSSNNPAGGSATGGSVTAAGASAGLRGDPGTARLATRGVSAPPIGAISPAPGSNNTTYNPTPNSGGPGGPLPGSGDNPTGNTPNFPTPNNPPPLSGS